MKISQLPIVPDQPAEVPPVYCRSIKITNFRCFKNPVEISLLDSTGCPAQWTIILGENGIGKTSILQCLAGASVRPDILPTKKKGSPDKPVVQPLWSAQEWLQWLLPRRHTKDQLFECSLELQKGTLLADPSSDLFPWKYGFKTSRKEGHFEMTSTIVAADPANMAGFLMYGYGAGRRMAVTSRVPYGPNPDDGLRTLFDDDRPLSNAEEWLLELDHLAKTPHNGQAKANHALKNVKALLLKVLPDIDDITTKVSMNANADQSPLVRVVFKHVSGALLDSRSLSFGYQTMTSWLVDLTRRLYQRYPGSKNPLAEPAIVLIDEIDLHLHPKWQQNVMTYLSDLFPNTQFIVSAHSPLIIQSSKANNIVLLQRDGKAVSVKQDLQSIKEWRVDQILTSDLFGLERVRAPESEKLFDERTALLSKSKLSAKDKRRLEILDAIIERLPMGETPEMREVEDLLRQVAAEHKMK
ncbi:AAA family ATPase [Prosthecobacter sp.]|uniref:AAA family ATPase n=1 Tax=Prosthecobacter sp. TaxID=1965333 RepID=UPI00378512A2